MARRVLIQDTEADPVMSYEDVAVLTGTETVGRTIYVGDEDPVIDHAADLIEGDQWIDTSGTWPTQNKIRNNVGGWTIAAMVLKDDANDYVVSRVEINAANGVIGIERSTFDDGLLGNIYLEADGTAHMLCPNGAEITVSPAGVITLYGAILAPSLPTADPAVGGGLWVDPAAAFVVKQSQG